MWWSGDKYNDILLRPVSVDIAPPTDARSRHGFQGNRRHSDHTAFTKGERSGVKGGWVFIDGV